MVWPCGPPRTGHGTGCCILLLLHVVTLLRCCRQEGHAATPAACVGNSYVVPLGVLLAGPSATPTPRPGGSGGWANGSGVQVGRRGPKHAGMGDSACLFQSAARAKSNAIPRVDSGELRSLQVRDIAFLHGYEGEPVLLLLYEEAATWAGRCGWLLVGVWVYIPAAGSPRATPAATACHRGEGWTRSRASTHPPATPAMARACSRASGAVRCGSGTASGKTRAAWLRCPSTLAGRSTRSYGRPGVCRQTPTAFWRRPGVGRSCSASVSSATTARQGSEGPA